ncbi:MAG: hypothetical protein M3303_02230 [Gemmatimonadota bacterium]|nr:hypothetical protein [Gemmatimonadota bacterium]
MVCIRPPPRPVFAYAAIVLAVTSFIPPRVEGMTSGTRDTLRIGVLLSADAADTARAESIRRGVELGVEEASRTAALFGLTVEVVTERGRAGADVLLAARRLAARPLAAMIAAPNDADCGALRVLAADRRVLLLNLDCAGDVPRRGACNRFLLYIRPGHATTTRARDRIATAASESDDDPPVIALWHHTLSRFGAAQLNERFRRRFALEMESTAWAGWMAMKILAEAALRGRSVGAIDLARYLARPDARFDGHKGEPLSVDRASGELRQPLYVLQPAAPGRPAGRVVAELGADALFGSRSGGQADACRAAGSDRG